MFRRLEPSMPEAGHIVFEGRRVPFRAGDTVAAALLLVGAGSVRDHPVGGAPRAPYCMMGACFECVVEIDALGSRRACLEPARDGMSIRRHRGERELP